jgi:hypothetical protein
LVHAYQLRRERPIDGACYLIKNTQAGESVRKIVDDFMSENKISMERLKNILSDHDFDKRLEAEIDAAGGCRQLAESFIKEAMSK